MLQCSQYLLASYPQQELWSDYYAVYAIYIQVCMNNTPHVADNFRKTVLLECIYERYHYYSMTVVSTIFHKCTNIAINVFTCFLLCWHFA